MLPVVSIEVVGMIAMLTGIVAGVLALAVVLVASASGRDASRPGPLGWAALVAGGLALAGLGLAFVEGMSVAPQASVGLAVAAAVLCVGAIVKGDRRWPTWVGVGLALAPVGFWIVFAVGEVLYPH